MPKQDQGQNLHARGKWLRAGFICEHRTAVRIMHHAQQRVPMHLSLRRCNPNCHFQVSSLALGDRWQRKSMHNKYAIGTCSSSTRTDIWTNVTARESVPMRSQTTSTVLKTASNFIINLWTLYPHYRASFLTFLWILLWVVGL